jgi:hypothetical protein
MRQLGIIVSGAIVLALTASEASAEVAPSFLRSISTQEYRAAVTRPDGTALTITRDGVILRDPAGGTRFVARLRGNQRAIPAPDALAFGVVTYADNAPSTLHASRFELYDVTGKKRFSLEKPKATEFRVAPAGSWTVGVAGGDGMHEAELHLYDSEGKAVSVWQVPYLSDLTLPPAGDRFFAASRQELRALPYAGGDPQPLGRFEIFGTSPDGRWVALCGAGSLTLFEGTEIVFTARTQLANVRAVAISPEGRYVALAGNDRLELYDREARKLLWTVTSGRESLRFISVAVTTAPLRILCGLDEDRGSSTPQAERHKSGAVFLLAEDGKLLWREELTYDKWHFRVPKVTFTRGSKQFEVELAGEHRYYSLP